MDIVLNALTIRAKILIQGALHNKQTLDVQTKGNRKAPMPVNIVFDNNRTTISFPPAEKMNRHNAAEAVLMALDGNKLDIVSVSKDDVFNICLKKDNERLRFSKIVLT